MSGNGHDHHSRIAILGLGQMGASLGLALKQALPDTHITGYDLSATHSEIAKNHGAVDDIAHDGAAAVSHADTVILCIPVGSYRSVMEQIAPHLKQGAILTDIGSIKLQAIRDIEPLIPPGVTFIPSHPIAGSEAVGPHQARADFFVDHLFLITPIKDTPEHQIQPILSLWQAIGSQVELLHPQLHDEIYAYMSHLPQLMAYAAMPVLEAQHCHLSHTDTYFSRFIRIGRSDAQMWHDVFLENATPVLHAASFVDSILTHMRDELMLGAAQATQQPDATLKQYLLKDAWPRMLASSIIVSVQMAEQQMELKLARFAAGGFTDVTCPATESPEGDMQHVSDYAPLFIELLNDYLAKQGEITHAIDQGDSAALIHLLSACQQSGKVVATPLV